MIVSQRQPQDLMASSQYPSSYPHDLSTAYPIPAQRACGRDGSQRNDGLSFAEHEMIRSRKTPHGRIREAYDASSHDKTIYMPASKHVLLSRSPQTSSTYQNYASRSHAQLHHHENTWPADKSERDGFSGQQLRTIVDTSRPVWNLAGGMDSTLHQTISVPDQRYYYHPGSQVPTVLPAALNAHSVPTASAGQQFYGPYWPDGTFSPYRPAPIRDSRFFGHSADHGFTAPGMSSDYQNPRYSVRFSVNHASNDKQQHYVPQQHTAPQPLLTFSDRVFSAATSTNDDHQHSYRAQPLDEPLIDFCGDNDHVRTRDADGSLPKQTLRPVEASQQIAFRDRTFSWAYQTYVELLARIQREHKHNRSIQPKMLAKPTIFPKPPQRPGSHFKDITSTTKSRFPSSQDDGVRKWYKQDPIISNHDQIASRWNLNPSNHEAMADRTPRGGPSIQNLDQSFTLEHEAFTPIQDPNLDPFQNHTYRSSTHLTALSALDTMDLLCNEAESPWTDGMLLAGCLAYGLGNYARALYWYQKVLLQDSRHVEAISNMAATLLALGRRDEALQHWQAAVKLRPSYFEAVEHLIGLLCTAQRGKDAVAMIGYVESQLRLRTSGEVQYDATMSDEDSDTVSRSSSITTMAPNERGVFDYDTDRRVSTDSAGLEEKPTGFGSSGYAISGADNGRLLALIHAKGNMLYGLGDNSGAAASFEDAILIATGHRQSGIQGLIRRILQSCVSRTDRYASSLLQPGSKQPILLSPEQAQETAYKMFPPNGELPGLEYVNKGHAHRAAISTTSNSLLSLAKIYQDGLGNTNVKVGGRSNGTREILALYYLSLSLQRSPSTANNVGILLASVQQTTANIPVAPQSIGNQIVSYAGIAPGSGSALALQYYNYGLNIDPKHAHLYTNLGSLLKDLGQLSSAIKMYEIAVQCDGNFDIALANLANAVKDQGRITDAITYYRRAVRVNPEFAEAVCGLATALNSVCNWYGRGGVYANGGSRDPIHVDDGGMMQEARKGCGWMNRVVEIVDRQLREGESWGVGSLTSSTIEQLSWQLGICKTHLSEQKQQAFVQQLQSSLRSWSGKRWEGARVVRLVERAIRQIGWQWYHDRYKLGKEYPLKRYTRPNLPGTLSSPTAPTVLPFHTFTTPLSAKQVRQISQRNALRISMSALRSPWLPMTVYPPPAPPAPCLNVGYVSSDFNNHPLAHLMQSIFGMHDTARVKAFCYATTNSDGSVHRHQIEREAPRFHDASSWSVERLVNQIVRDNIHILVNLNGYTRGARNEVFAARPAPIHMSFMGFAGTLGAEWSDYVFADSISVLPKTLAPQRRNVEVEDYLQPNALVEDREDWMYAENVIFAKSTFFCVDHKQSAPDAEAGPPPLQDRNACGIAWEKEQRRRWQLRKELFPTLPDSAVILGNFNQLYKIDPATFRMYLRILSRVPNAILWLLRFPDIGEQNLKSFARDWAGEEVASRMVFTDVAPKGAHITRASVVDLFLDTPECNAHTTAADVIWSGTPIVTWARWDYKMCSRMASSIVASAFPDGPVGDQAKAELLVNSDEQYERQAVSLALDLKYSTKHGFEGRGQGRLMELRRILWEGRWTSRLFDTRRWVRDLETAYWAAWENWETGEGGDIWL